MQEYESPSRSVSPEWERPFIPQLISAQLRSPIFPVVPGLEHIAVPSRLVLIASGSHAEVYAGCDGEGKATLAFKRLRLSADNIAESNRRFERELVIWAALRHDNVLPLLGVALTDAGPCLVSPLLGKGDLLTVASARVSREISAEEVLANADSSCWEHRTARGISAGLLYLHSCNIIHGDLKAANILMDDHGVPKICDFGLTKALDSAYSSTSLGLKGTGTIAHMAPELFYGFAKSFQSDVYAFGMTLVEVITGTMPFAGLPVANVILLVISGQRPSTQPLSRYGHSFDGLWKLVSACWNQASEARPSTAVILARLVESSIQ